MERETIAIFNVTMKTPFNVGMLVTVVAACCRVGMWLEIVDQTYESEIGLALTMGFGTMLYAGSQTLRNAIRKRL